MQTQIKPIFRVATNDPEVMIVVNVDATTARRKVSGWCGGYVATTCGGSVPELVIKEGKAFWRVPVVFTVIGKGAVGEIGAVMVDAETSDLLDATEQAADTMRDNASAIYQRLKAEGHTFKIRVAPADTEATHA